MKRTGSYVMAVTLAGILSLGGCSHLASQPPPPRPMQHPAECSDSRLPVFVDYYLATSTASLALLAAAGAKLTYDREKETVVPSWERPKRAREHIYFLVGTSLAAAAGTVMFVRSASHGLASARACDAALSEFNQRHLGPFWPPAAPPYPGPFPQPPQVPPPYGYPPLPPPPPAQ